MRWMGIVVCMGGLLFSCGRIPTNIGETATLRLLVRIDAPTQAMAKAAATRWDSLIVSVRSANLSVRRFSFAVNAYASIVEKEIAHLPAGDDRIVEVWTVDRACDTIHGVERDTVDLEVGKHATVSLILKPIRGSIYVVLTDIPTTVDSIVAAFFSTAGKTYAARTKASSRTFIAIDKVPYGSEGVLLIAGLSAGGDTIASWRNANFVFAYSNLTIESNFVNIGTMTLQVKALQPAVTVVRGTMDTTRAEGDEKGPLIVSELMFTSTVSSQPMEYIELYNPTTETVTLDTMFIDISGTRKTLVRVSVPPRGYYTVGSNAIPTDSAVWSAIDTTISLDLVSTTAVIYVLKKDLTVIDWVAYENSQNNMGWPLVSSSAKRSIVLDSLSIDPEVNNYGVNWSTATTAFSCMGITFYGTPGRPGR